MRILLLGTTLPLLAVCLSLHGVQASVIGVPVPKPTATGQSITSTPTAPFTWTPVTLPYGMNGTGQMAVGGTVDATTRLSVNPQGTAENGVTIKMPSGATGNYLTGKNSANTTTWYIPALGSPDFPGTGAYSETIGAGYNSSGQSSSAFGYGAVASGGYSCAFGRGASTPQSGAIALGYNSQASGAYAVTAGYGSQAAGAFTFALGQGANAPYAADVVIGSSTATAANQMVVGAVSIGYQVNDIYFGGGVTNSTVPNTTINPTGGNGTDVSGGSLTIAGGKSTGVSAPGKVFFATSTAGVTGTALQTLTNRVQVDPSGLIVLGTGTLTAPTVNATTAFQANGTPGLTVTVPLAKLTSGGTNGSLTFTGGILTASTNPT